MKKRVKLSRETYERLRAFCELHGVDSVDKAAERLLLERIGSLLTFEERKAKAELLRRQAAEAENLL